MNKSDLGVFGIRILGYVLGIIISLIGIVIMLTGGSGFGLFILILGLVIGRYLVWKSQRREGVILTLLP